MDDQELRASALRSAVRLYAAVGTPAERDRFDLIYTAASFERYIRQGFGIDVENERAETAAELEGQPESDDHLRQRLVMTAGRATVHYRRILTDAGARLDEVASFYDLKRRGV